jgi:hypothetical protein
MCHINLRLSNYNKHYRCKCKGLKSTDTNHYPKQAQILLCWSQENLGNEMLHHRISLNSSHGEQYDSPSTMVKDVRESAYLSTAIEAAPAAEARVHILLGQRLRLHRRGSRLGSFLTAGCGDGEKARIVARQLGRPHAVPGRGAAERAVEPRHPADLRRVQPEQHLRDAVLRQIPKRRPATSSPSPSRRRGRGAHEPGDSNRRGSPQQYRVRDLECSSRDPGDLEKGGGGLRLSAGAPIAIAPPRRPCRQRRGDLSASSSFAPRRQSYQPVIAADRIEAN